MTRFRPEHRDLGDAGRGRRTGGPAAGSGSARSTFRVPKPCDRCVVTTTDQETGERGREPLRTLARYRHVDQALLFATNLIPDAPGEIAVGDEVRML